MPARLVTSPKTYVYTKNEAGVLYNLSSYVVSGRVQRLINQVSSAEVTLRNPYKRFTTPSQGVAFHPMDPITIYLERVPGFPVRVFTGYLDTTPYYQLYPGTITLQASCTLKRLLYSYFDPSLPYVIAFFEKYGWINTGQGSIISQQAFNSKNAATQADVNAGKQPFTDLQDGSLAKLLWAILFDIGEWRDSNIYIENLPTGANGIAARMAQLMKSIQKGEEAAASDFTLFLNKVVGGGSQGSGGGTGGATINLSGKLDVYTWAAAVLQAMSLPVTTDNIKALTGWANEESGGQWGTGQNDDPLTTHNPLNTTQHETGSTIMPGGSTAGVQQYPDWNTGVKAAVDTLTLGSYASIVNLLKGGHPSASEFANAIVSSPWGTLDGAGIARLIQAANPPSNLTSGTGAATASAGSSIASSVTGVISSVFGSSSGSSSGSGGSSSGNNGKSALGNIFPFGTKGIFVERTDAGVDFQVPDGTSIGAIASGTFGVWQKNWFPINGIDQPIMGITLDTPIDGFHSWYIAEGVTPDQSKVGKHVNAGDSIGTTHNNGSGIETGWGNASSTQQAASGDSVTPEGSDFANYIGVPISASQHVPLDWSKLKPGANTGGSGGAGSGGAGTTSGSAEAFVAELQFPSVEDQVTAIALGAEHKGLMHDQSLMPFVQQVTQASMRSFQSLPNGDFYAFYPDYFGEMGHHKPYWMIRDIEILSGGINLTDDALATHVFAVGDNTWPVNNELLNMLFSAGTVNVFNAFLGKGIVDAPTAKGKGDMGSLMNASEAVKFIQRYGARPLVQNYPMVRSPIFEMLLAYQQFLLAWSNQFKTPFTFTFMPELFPGGKVGFPDHGIQMYINSVTHEWNYEEGGFTTTADLSAPALLEGVNSANFPDIPPFMVQAMVEPVQTPSKADVKQALQSVASIVDQSVSQITGELFGNPF